MDISTIKKHLKEIDDRDSDGKTVLFHSLENQETMSFLIENGANLNIKDKHGNTALLDAINYYSEKEVITLLDAKTNIELQNNDGQTALMLAASKGLIQAVINMITRETNLDIQDKDGKTALIYSIEAKRPEISTLLILSKSDINLRDNKDRSSLMYAIKSKNRQNITSLIECGAILENAMEYAINENDTTTVRLLLNNKVDVLNKNYMSIASQKNFHEIVSILLEFKCDINELDENKNTPINNAILNNSVDSVKLLLGHKASIDTLNNEKKSSIFLANTPDCMNLLIKNKANVNKICNNKTPLFTFKDNKQIVKLLVTAGAYMDPILIQNGNNSISSDSGKPTLSAPLFRPR